VGGGPSVTKQAAPYAVLQVGTPELALAQLDHMDMAAMDSMLAGVGGSTPRGSDNPFNM
jgi:hypothetical protein